MARGKDRHDAHRAALLALGKDLSRRAGSGCELCEEGFDHRPIEVQPTLADPALDRAILACARCRDTMTAKRLPREAADFRFLETAAWADPVPVKVAAVRLLRRLDAEGVGWASEVLDGLWLPEEVEERLS
jgi:protein PhnA